MPVMVDMDGRIGLLVMIAFYAGVIALILVLSLSGCSSISYRHGDIEFSRTSLGTNTAIGGLRVMVGNDGSKVLEMDDLKSEQTTAIEAAARGAAAGASPLP